MNIGDLNLADRGNKPYFGKYALQILEEAGRAMTAMAAVAFRFDWHMGCTVAGSTGMDQFQEYRGMPSYDGLLVAEWFQRRFRWMKSESVAERP